jgi:hypothetical protein
LEKAPLFLPEELQELHSYFMSEKPPDDLHLNSKGLTAAAAPAK